MRAYARAIEAPPPTQSTDRGGGNLRKIKRTIYVVQDNQTARKFIKGKPVPNYVALALTADEFSLSVDGLRKAFAQIERAQAVG